MPSPTNPNLLKGVPAMFKFLKYAFATYNFCCVNACWHDKTIVVFCKSKPTNNHLPESFNALIDYITKICDAYETKVVDSHIIGTYHFDDIVLILEWCTGT